MTASTARVAVIIPCYNLGAYLAEAVDSVTAQDFHSVEIVVVDDGSTEDATKRLLEDFSRPGVRVIRSSHQGLPAARNIGVAETTAPYLCMLDADDRLEPSMLAKSAAVLDENPDIAFVSHWLRAFGDETWEWTPERCDFPALLDTNTVNGAALIRRNAFDAVGGFDETMRDGFEDWDFWIALVERGFQGRILPEVLFHYRRRPDSMSRVSFANGGFARLYAQLARKHAASFQRHMPSVIGTREAAIGRLHQHIQDLELEHERTLKPELERWRDEVATLKRKAAHEVERQKVVEELDRLRGVARQLEHARDNETRRADEARADAEDWKAEALRLAGVHDEDVKAIRAASAEIAQVRQAEATAGQIARRLDAEAHHHREDAAQLRASASWRMTAPLRAVFAFWLRLIGRKS